MSNQDLEFIDGKLVDLSSLSTEELEKLKEKTQEEIKKMKKDVDNKLEEIENR